MDDLELREEDVACQVLSVKPDCAKEVLYPADPVKLFVSKGLWSGPEDG